MIDVRGFHGVRAFRHRNYRLFFAGQGISLIGTWIQQVAQGWLVLQLTGDPLMIGVVGLCQFGPVILLGLFGGVIADQLPKRRTLLVTQVVSMVLAFALFGLTATGLVEVWHVAVLAALLGIANAVDMPTRQSFAVEMVGKEDVANAVGLGAAQFNSARIIGPAVAGLAIALFDTSIAFLINGLSYVAVIAAYALMRDEDLRPVRQAERARSVAAVLGNLREGLAYVRRTPIVLLAVLVVFLVATVGMNNQVLIPPLADHVLKVGAVGYGFLMAASGIGSTIAALWVAFSRRVRPMTIAAGALVMGLAVVVVGLSGSYALSLLAMGIAGLGGIAMAVAANTTIQLTVPDELRGRVMSVYTTTFSASVPAGGLLMGFVASRWGAPVALVLGGVLTVAVAVPALLWLQRSGAPAVSMRPVVAAGAAAADPRSLTGARPR